MAVRHLKCYASWVQTVQRLIAESTIERFEPTRRMTKNKLTAAFYRNIEGPYQLISVEPTLVVYERAIPREAEKNVRTRIDYDTDARSAK